MPTSESGTTQAPGTTTDIITNGPSESAIASEMNGHSTHDKVLKTKFAVYCGASPGNRPEHLAMARELARAMHKHDIGLGIFVFSTFIYSWLNEFTLTFRNSLRWGNMRYDGRVVKDSSGAFGS